MVKLVGMLNRFNPVRALVIGDFMLDTYTTGKVKRVSPEAPVCVLHVQKEESLPGGAGNVALNLIALGAEVYALGRVGFDRAGDELKESLASSGVIVDGIVGQKEFKTPLKNRLIADSQQILRVDFETAFELSEEVEEFILKQIPDLLNQVEVVAISDYGKGFLTYRLLHELIKQALIKQIPVIVDPKGDDFSKYSGATMIKPNLTEAYAAARLNSGDSLDLVAKNIFSQCNIEFLLITKSEAGISLFQADGVSQEFPVRSKEVKDVTGAGDTVLAILAFSLANMLPLKYAAQLANIAAGIAIEKMGCARVGLAELAERLLEFDVENKIFDEEHLYALQQVLQDKKVVVLGLDSRGGITIETFRVFRMLSSQEEKLIVYLQNEDPSNDFLLMLSSFAEVDFIVLKCDSLTTFCERIHPHKIHVLEEGRLKLVDHAGALLNRLRLKAMS